LRDALGDSSWHAVERVDLIEQGGYHEALGAMALATAARLLAAPAGSVTQVLVLSGGPGAFMAWLLGKLPATGG